MRSAQTSLCLTMLASVLTSALACGTGGGDDGDSEVVLPSSSTGEDTTPISTVTGAATTSGTTESPTTEGPGSDSDSDSSSSSSTSSTSTTTGADPTTTGVEAVCGNGVVEPGEECDDGNPYDDDACVAGCKHAICGDKLRQMGVEECDDGNESDADWCTNECKLAFCGDGFVYAGFEECDDGNDDQTDACINDCKIATCGDGNVWEGVEVCDDGFNDNVYNGCAPGCQKRGPHCGDGVVQSNQGERCDTTVKDMPGVTCTPLTCMYNFSAVNQMYCAGTCSWAGPDGCDSNDAAIFCRLKTGNIASKAVSFTLGSPTNSFGFPCGNPKDKAVVDGQGNDPRINLGKLPEFLVNQPVMYQVKDILLTHGNKPAITSVVCTNPP